MTQTNKSFPPPEERPRSNFFASFPIDEEIYAASSAGQSSHPPGASPEYQLTENNDDEDIAPPAYGELHDQINLSQAGFEAGAAVTADGRVNININQKNHMLADLLLRTATNTQTEGPSATSTAATQTGPLPPPYIPPSLGGSLEGQTPPPKLNVVIQIVGSRGDVQPFVALGKVLRDTYGHRVRVATHPTFKDFVIENGLEFFSIGGDPAELMAFMVKNPGLMPGMDALKRGEITKRRKGIEEIVVGCWRSCIEAGDGISGVGLAPAPGGKPFVADAIIANPPSFAHVHVAEKLGIPLHIMFTMPWSPTKAFAHPLANIESSNTDPVMTNYVSYAMVEMMTWQGLGDVINRFRQRVLDLEPLSLMWAPGLLSRLRVPTTYCWSPALIPKPADWGNEVTIAGFFFLDLATSYTPDAELAAFLKAGPPPVYIGFGSIVVDDPNALTRKILDAVSSSGVRALVSKGWGGLGADDVGLPEGVFMLGNVPHDWLFQHVSAVVHHGGAGTSAAGIKAGKPTVVVPFFGDQPFWGSMIAKAGAGPAPIPFTKLTAENLAAAILEAVKPETQLRAQELGARIREEKGADVGGKSFHEFLNTDSLRCSLAPSRTAVWRVRRTKTRLSALAAAVLVSEGLLKFSDLKLYRPVEHNTEEQPWDPISAVTAGLLGDISTMAMAVGDFPREMFRGQNWRKTMADIQGRTKSQTSISKKDGDSATAPTTTDASSATRSVTSLPGASEPFAQSQVSLASYGGNSLPGQAGSSTPTGSKSPGRNNKKGKAAADDDDVMNKPVTLDTAVGAGEGVSRIVGSGFKMPLNVCLGLARGFRNAPKLYSDDTIRPQEKVTDFASGVRVAGKEFGLGWYDGIAGLVTQPIRGAKKEGAAGLIKGFGKGIGGLMLKPASAIWALPAYTMQGVHAEVRKMSSRSSTNSIITARVWQGKEDLEGSSAEERNDILLRWQARDGNGDLKGFRQVKMKEQEREREVLAGMAMSPSSTLSLATDASTAVGGSLDDVSVLAQGSSSGDSSTLPTTGTGPPKTGWFHTRNMSYEQRKKLHEQKEAWKAANAAKKKSGDTQQAQEPQTVQSQATPLEDEEFEAAIRASVAQTSKGDKDEDAKVEAAIRNSIREMGLVAQRQQEMEKEGKDKGTAVANPTEAGGSAGLNKLEADAAYFTNVTDEEYQALIEEAVKKSLTNQAHGQGIRESDEESYDEDFMKALEASRTDSFGPPLPARTAAAQSGGTEADDDEIRKAIEESERQHREQMEMVNRQQTEEDIVLEYVKKQSLAEEQFRIKRKAVGSGESLVSGKGKDKAVVGGDDEDVDDEDLRRALELSMQDHGGRGSGSAGPSGSRGTGNGNGKGKAVSELP
ncbi:hypothetical protein V8F06_005314 [Rhypophila decipiens]